MGSWSGGDLFGSDSENAPAWVGNWEAVDVEPESVDFPRDDTRILFSISRDSIGSFTKVSGGTCQIPATEIVHIDDNVVTTEQGDEDQDDTRLGTSYKMRYVCVHFISPNPRFFCSAVPAAPQGIELSRLDCLRILVF